MRVDRSFGAFTLKYSSLDARASMPWQIAVGFGAPDPFPSSDR